MSGRAAEWIKKLWRAAINVAISLGAVLVTLVVLEFALRPFVELPATIGSSSYTTPDPVLGWRLKPNEDRLVWMADRNVRIETNSHGFRDVEHAYEKPDGVFRVLVLGDSFMEGFSVSADEVFARRFEELAHEAGLSQVEVINLGVGGYSTLQSYLAFVEEGVKYQPDLVLLGFFTGNDVQDNYRPLQIAMSDESGSSVANRPYLISDAGGQWEIEGPDYQKALEIETHRKEQAWWQKSLLISMLFRAITNRTLNRSELEPGEGSSSVDTGVWIGQSFCEEIPLFTEGWAVTERILVELDSAVQESGAQLVVFTVPSREEVDFGYGQRVANSLVDPDALCLEEAVANKRILGILENDNIPAIDLLPSFRSALREEDRRLFARDRHWNAEGHALAADEVFETLSAEGFLPIP
jgi:hypothetical protein